MKALIFGANGQDGFYLSELLRSEGLEIIQVSRRGEGFVHADVSDFATVSLLIKDHLPDYIFHLAANSTTRHNAIFENHLTISTGTLNILETVKTFCPGSKVFISGSGLQFKNNGKPIGESDDFEARDAYSVSRIQSVYAARYYRMLGLKVYVGYFFNHDSPRRSNRHLAKFIAETVQQIQAGKATSLEIGDLSVQKEWGFAGDIVKALWTLVCQDRIFEATLGTGRAYSVSEYIAACFSLVGQNWKDFVQIKPGFEAEYSMLVSDPSTIFSLGWRPETSMDELAQMMLTI
jgi:GDPmannose 4,6-dehydratase